MRVINISVGCEIITIMHDEGDWQALIVEGSTLIWQTSEGFDTVEDALLNLLESLSLTLNRDFEGQIL